MKKIRLLFIALVSLASLAFTTGDDWTSCRAAYEKVEAIYDVYNTDEFYLHYTMQETISGVNGEVIDQEIWLKGNQSIVENQFVRIIQDASTNVMILKQQQYVVIRHAGGLENRIPKMKIMHIDSLANVIQTSSCSETGSEIELDMAFKPDYVQKTHLKSLKVKADTATNRMLSGEYITSQYGKDKKMVYNYLGYNTTVSSTVFGAQATDEIYQTDGSVKPAYQAYQIKDLRQ